MCEHERRALYAHLHARGIDYASFYVSWYGLGKPRAVTLDEELRLLVAEFKQAMPRAFEDFLAALRIGSLDLAKATFYLSMRLLAIRVSQRARGEVVDDG